VALFKKFANSSGPPKNCIDHPILQQLPLFLSFDFFHALKNARSLFLDHNIHSSEGIISSSYLKECCGIVKASKFSNTAENINFVSSARIIQNLISRNRANNFEDFLIPIIGNTNSNSSTTSNYSPCRKHFFGISGFFSRIH
jgi:hypothetical protein